MAIYTNIHGQEPSPAAPPEFGRPSEVQVKFRDQLRAQGKHTPTFMPLRVARAGREGIDVTRCQAPVNRGKRGRLVQLCTRPPTCVIVENKPRPDGAIGAMTLCAICYKTVLDTQGPNYAKMTPLVP